MPKKKPTFVPFSEGEMELLDLLWKLGPSPLAVVHSRYSGSLTTLQCPATICNLP